MKIFRADIDNIKKGRDIIQKGGVVIFPTDTVYGLGCNPFKIEPIKKILKIKGKRRSPLPILASSIKQVKRTVVLNEVALKIIRRFWPGGLTVVLPRRLNLPKEVTHGRKTLGIRVPDNDFIIQLLKTSGGLMIGTSANRSGENPPTNLHEVAVGIRDEVDLIFNGGETKSQKPSTVIDLTGDEVKILRKGAIPETKIFEVVNKN